MQWPEFKVSQIYFLCVLISFILIYMIDRKVKKHVLLVVIDVFFVDYIKGKILKKNGDCLFNLWKNIRDVLLSFIYSSLICNFLFKMFIVDIYLVLNGILTILCLMSVMRYICLKSLRKNLFCSIVQVWISNN